MEFKALIKKAREIAGYKKNENIRDYNVCGELKNLQNLILARDLIMEYATAQMWVEIRKTKSPWTDNFGDSDDIDLPVLLIDGKPSAKTYWQRQRTIEFVLEELNPDIREREFLITNLDRIKAWETLYKQNVGF